MVPNDIEPFFEKIENENVKIWRYMNFWKFKSLINKKSLYLSVANKFHDKFEGAITKKDADDLMKKWGNVLKYHNLPVEKFIKTESDSKDHMFVNCWHMREYESAQMWERYIEKENGKTTGIAIQTTYSKLKNSLPKGVNNIYLGKVKYIDFEQESVLSGNSYNHFFYKMRELEDEREIRLAVLGLWFENGQLINPDGIFCPISLNDLIEKIVIYSKDGEFDELKNRVQKLLRESKLEKNIELSRLNNTPYFH